MEQENHEIGSKVSFPTIAFFKVSKYRLLFDPLVNGSITLTGLTYSIVNS